MESIDKYIKSGKGAKMWKQGFKEGKQKRICYKCGKVIKDNSAIGWFIVRDRLYCRECAWIKHDEIIKIERRDN